MGRGQITSTGCDLGSTGRHGENTTRLFCIVLVYMILHGSVIVPSKDPSAGPRLYSLPLSLADEFTLIASESASEWYLLELNMIS